MEITITIDKDGEVDPAEVLILRTEEGLDASEWHYYCAECGAPVVVVKADVDTVLKHDHTKRTTWTV